jgi:hypothetical protein
MEAQTKKQLRVELFKVEMPSSGESSCSACDTVQSKLVSAIEDVQRLFDKLDCEILFKQTTIRTIEEAEQNQISASPTIRVGNLDFFPEHLSDCSETREWNWKGQSMTEPTNAILIEVLLKGYFEQNKTTEKKELSKYILKHLKEGEVNKPNCGCK